MDTTRRLIGGIIGIGAWYWIVRGGNVISLELSFLRSRSQEHFPNQTDDRCVSSSYMAKYINKSPAVGLEESMPKIDRLDSQPSASDECVP